MAVIFDSTSSGHLSPFGSSSVTFAHTIAQANETLLVHTSGKIPISITYNGVALTKIAGLTGGAQPNSSVWALRNPATGTNNIIATGADAFAEFWADASSWKNTDQSADVDSFVTYDNGFAGTAVALSPVVPTGGLSVGIYSGSDTAQTVTPDSPAVSIVGRNTTYLSSLAYSANASNLSWTASAGMQVTAIAVVLKTVATGVAVNPGVKALTVTGYAPSIVRGAPAGTLTPPTLKNNTATVQASVANMKVGVFDSTGTYVVTKTVSADASGNFSISDALFTVGSTYYGLIVDTTGGRMGSFKVVAT